MNKALLDLLRLQHGLVTSRQVCQLETNRTLRRSIYGRDDVVWETPRVLRHLAAPATVEQQMMLAVLDAGPDGLLWGKSAACHWGFGRFRRLPAHVAIPRRNVRYDDRPGHLHIVRNLDDRDRTVYMDIPIARPEVVALWLAGMWTHRYGHEIAADRTANALDQAWRQRLIDGRFLHDLAERSGGCGRSGIVVLRQLLEERPPDYQPAGSRLEERFEEMLPERIRCQLRRQVSVDPGPVIRTVDYRLATWPLIVEINGEAFHSSVVDRAFDESRYERFVKMGYSVAIFWEHDIWHDSAVVAETMRTLVERPDDTPTIYRPTPVPWTF